MSRRAGRTSHAQRGTCGAEALRSVLSSSKHIHTHPIRTYEVKATRHALCPTNAGNDQCGCIDAALLTEDLMGHADGVLGTNALQHDIVKTHATFCKCFKYLLKWSWSTRLECGSRSSSSYTAAQRALKLVAMMIAPGNFQDGSVALPVIVAGLGLDSTSTSLTPRV